MTKHTKTSRHIEEGEIYYCGTDCHSSGDVEETSTNCANISASYSAVR